MSAVKEYVGDLVPSLRTLVRTLDTIVREAVPAAEASLKWGNLTYHHGRNFCAILAHDGYVNLQIWGGAKIADPKKLLVGAGKSMRHVRIEVGGSLDRRAVTAIVRAAARAASAERTG